MRFDNCNAIVFRNVQELAETIKRLVLRYNNVEESSPLLTWGEFSREILGIFKNNDICINYLSDIYKEDEEKYYMLLPVDLFRNGYEMVDCDGYVSNDIPFKKRHLLEAVGEDDKVTLSFKLGATPVMWDDSYKGTMVEEREGVYKIEYPHEMKINFDIKLSYTDDRITKFSQLYFYVTDVTVEVLK